MKSYALAVGRTRRGNRATVGRDDRARRLAAPAASRENVVTFSLLRQAGRWRIDDISGVAEPNAWSLRDMLAGARPVVAMKQRGLAFALVALIGLAARRSPPGPLDELRRSFTLDGKPVPPGVFRDSATPISAIRGPRSSAIDVKAAMNSNRYGDPIALPRRLGDAKSAGGRFAERRRGDRLSLCRRDEERAARRHRLIQRRRQRRLHHVACARRSASPPASTATAAL